MVGYFLCRMHRPSLPEHGLRIAVAALVSLAVAPAAGAENGVPIVVDPVAMTASLVDTSLAGLPTLPLDGTLPAAPSPTTVPEVVAAAAEPITAQEPQPTPPPPQPQVPDPADHAEQNSLRRRIQSLRPSSSRSISLSRRSISRRKRSRPRPRPPPPPTPRNRLRRSGPGTGPGVAVAPTPPHSCRRSKATVSRIPGTGTGRGTAARIKPTMQIANRKAEHSINL